MKTKLYIILLLLSGRNGMTRASTSDCAHRGLAEIAPDWELHTGVWWGLPSRGPRSFKYSLM